MPLSSLLAALPPRALPHGRAAVAAALLLGAAPVLAAEPPAWDERGALSRVLTVGPAQAGSLCLPLPAQQRVVWAFVAQQPMDFDIQFSDGSRAEASARRQAAREAQGLLEARQGREHCWSWRNRGEQAAQVAVQLRRR